MGVCRRSAAVYHQRGHKWTNLQDGIHASAAPPSSTGTEDTERDVLGIDERPRGSEYRNGRDGYEDTEWDGV